MKKYLLIIAALLGWWAMNAAGQTTAAIPVLHINADQVVAHISARFSGMMTEEINHSYEGGLYAVIDL